jgi:hypothetical protein
MYFEIQVGDPLVLDAFEESREDLSSAIRAVFPEATEDAILVWNWVPVRLNYNADSSVIIEDVLLMLTALLQSSSGSHSATFGASTFRANWLLNWDAGTVRIQSRWDSVAGGYEDLLNERQELKYPMDQFLCEWKCYLRKIFVPVQASGLVLLDMSQFSILQKVESAIPGFGRLYRLAEGHDYTGHASLMRASLKSEQK